MEEAIEKLGLHLTLMLHSAGADEEALKEIIASLERAKEREAKFKEQDTKES